MKIDRNLDTLDKIGASRTFRVLIIIGLIFCLVVILTTADARAHEPCATGYTVPPADPKISWTFPLIDDHDHHARHHSRRDVAPPTSKQHRLNVPPRATR